MAGDMEDVDENVRFAFYPELQELEE